MAYIFLFFRAVKTAVKFAFYLVFALLVSFGIMLYVVSAQTAHAFTSELEIVPNGNTFDYNFTITGLQYEDIDGYTPGEFVCFALYNITLDLEQVGTGDIHSIDPISHTLNEVEFTFTVNSQDIPEGDYLTFYVQSQVGEGTLCTNASANGFLELYGNSIEPYTPIFTVTHSQVSSNIWGSSTGFWGDITPGDMTATVAQSTGETFDNVSPLFSFVGIPVAFAIASFMVFFVYRTLRNVDAPINDYRALESLEPRKKRGRPKKKPLEESPVDK